MVQNGPKRAQNGPLLWCVFKALPDQVGILFFHQSEAQLKLSSINFFLIDAVSLAPGIPLGMYRPRLYSSHVGTPRVNSKSGVINVI